MDTQTFKKQLEQHEGFRGRVYDDATGLPLKPGNTLQGKPTVGIGRNLLDNPVSKNEAYYLLKNDLVDRLKDLQIIFPEWKELPENIQLVFADMHFNLGANGFRSFKNMIAAAKQRNWFEMKREMLNSRWAEQVGWRADNLAEMVNEVMKDR